MPNDLCKVRFQIAQNDDGCPPFTSEAMWCIRLGENRFRVDNIPFFAHGVSYCDVISVSASEDGRLNFDEVVEENGHSTLRVLFGDADQRPENIVAHELATELQKHGCLTDVSPSPIILAVDVPPSIALKNVRKILAEGESKGLWSYEEATLAHPD